MKRAILYLACGALCLGQLMFAQDVSTQFDQTMDFTGLHTYKWVSIENDPNLNPITASNIKTLINQALMQKGFVEVAGNATPDFLVGYQTSVSKEQQLNWYNDGGPWMGGFGSATTSTISVGTLDVDIYYPAQRRLIWRGTATKTLNPSSNADKNYDNLRKAVDKLLKNFPPKKK